MKVLPLTMRKISYFIFVKAAGLYLRKNKIMVHQTMAAVVYLPIYKSN